MTEAIGSNPPQHFTSEKSGVLNWVRTQANKRVEEAHLPNENYESTVGVYGGKIRTYKNKEGDVMVYDNRGTMSQIDRIGDGILRSYDDHTVKDSVAMLRRHPRRFVKELLHPGPKRARAKQGVVVEQIHRLGLDAYYGAHPWGIEIKKPDLYKKGVALQDIFRQDVVNSPYVNDLDRFSALVDATKYIKNMHDAHGAVGALGVESIIFEDKTGNQVTKPVLNLHTVFFNPDKHISETEQKATDMLDFLAGIGNEELRRSNNWENVNKALNTITDNYDDPKIIAVVKSLAKRGRLTLPGDVSQSQSRLGQKLHPAFALHNIQRLHASAETSTQLRSAIVASCQQYLSSKSA